MSEIQVHGQLTQVDENGDVTIMLPHTTTDDITGVLPVEKGGTGVTTREQFFSDTLNETFGITNPDDLYEKISTHTISKDDLNGGYANLDDYRSPGVYYFKVGTVKTSKHPECIVEELMNPDDFTPPGYLYIMSNDTRTYLSQFWFTTNSKAIYRRNYESGIWRDWDTFIDFPEIGDDLTKIYFGECTSETGTSNEIKNITTTNEDFTFEKDSVVIIEFTSNNVSENPKINIDNTGEKDIYYKGVTSTSAYFAINDYHTALKRGTYIFVYSHQRDQYELTGYINNVTTMTGATETDNGVAGLVPRPEAGDQSKFLRGDGEWVDVIGATGELIASPNVGSASGTLKIEHGGTGATTAGVGLYNLSFHTPTESGINLDSLINNDDMGYWYFGSEYLPTNAPVENTTGYLFVLRGGGSLRKQIWMNQGAKNNHQDMYVRTRGGSEWQPWIKIKNSRTALVGSDIRGETGWHKVASGSLTGYSNTSLIFAVHNTKTYSSGILVVDIRSSDSVLTCGKFGWLVSDDINFDDYMLNITDNTWILYYKVEQQYYRNVFEVIEESGTNTNSTLYELFSNQTKESETPTATTSITSKNLTSISVNSDSITGVLPVEKGGTGASTEAEALLNLSYNIVPAGGDLNTYNNDNSIGYYSVITSTSIANCPDHSGSGLLFVFPAYIDGRTVIKQFYTELFKNETDYNYGNIYSRQYTNTWSSWSSLGSNKIAYVGKNASPNIWYKVASGKLKSISSNVQRSLTFLVNDMGRNSLGILQLTLQKLVNTDYINIVNFNWIMSINIDPRNYKIDTNSDSWTLYFLSNVPITTTFQVIGDDDNRCYTTTSINYSNYELFSNIDGLSTVPNGRDSEICVIPNTKEIKLDGGPLYFKKYTDDGFYWSNGGSRSSSDDERISGGGNLGPFSLEVVKLGDNSCMQIRTLEEDGQQERRFKNTNNEWSEWEYYITENNVEQLVIEPYINAHELTDGSDGTINSKHHKGSYYYNGDEHDTEGTSKFSLEVIETGVNSCMQTKITPATGIEERRFYNYTTEYNGWSDWEKVNNFIAPYFITSDGPSNYKISTSIFKQSNQGIARLYTGTIIYVRFNTTNNAGATLEITATGAKKPIYYGSTPIGYGVIGANSVVPLIFDKTIVSGGAWMLIGAKSSSSVHGE